MTFVGLDLHKRYITACALDAGGAILGEVRRMPVSLGALCDFLGAFPTPVTVGMEATLQWQWLHDELECAGHVVRVADARQVKLIWQARSKTDPIDARKLAELLRVNLFPAIWIPDANTRRRRQLLHGRAFLVGNAPRSGIEFMVGSPQRISSSRARICTAGRVVPGWRRSRSHRHSAARSIACCACTMRLQSKSMSSTRRSGASAAITR